MPPGRDQPRSAEVLAEVLAERLVMFMMIVVTVSSSFSAGERHKLLLRNESGH